jgi:hypothetical protein
VPDDHLRADLELILAPASPESLVVEAVAKLELPKKLRSSSWALIEAVLVDAMD